MEINIATAILLVYELDAKGSKIRSYYLLDEEELKSKMDTIHQGKTWLLYYNLLQSYSYLYLNALRYTPEKFYYF